GREAIRLPAPGDPPRDEHGHEQVAGPGAEPPRAGPQGRDREGARADPEPGIGGRGLPERGILFVLSAPSGTGKSSLAGRVVSAVPGLVFSVSYTTRQRRGGEVEGREYHFVDDSAFDSMVERDELLE